MKKQKIEEKQKEIEKIKYECRTNKFGLIDDLETDLDEINRQGASCLKYEIIKKGNKKVMQAKRCSKRNAPIGFADNMNNISKDTSFEYCPNQLENLFDQDENTKKIQSSAIKKKLVIQQDDIEDIIGALDSENKIILIKTNSQKFKSLSSDKKIAAFIGKPSEYDQFVSENTECKYLNKFYVVKVTPQAKNYIKDNAFWNEKNEFFRFLFKI